MTTDPGMHVVVQENLHGCGIAAVANIVGLSYAQVKAKAKSIGICASDNRLFSETDYVRKLLDNYGFECRPGEQVFVSWDSLPDQALLAINGYEQQDSTFWHWVVFKRIKGKPVVMDSSLSIETHERYDFSSIEPAWFIELTASK